MGINFWTRIIIGATIAVMDAIYNVGINQNTLYLDDYVCRKKYPERGV